MEKGTLNRYNNIWPYGKGKKKRKKKKDFLCYLNDISLLLPHQLKYYFLTQTMNKRVVIEVINKARNTLDQKYGSLVIYFTSVKK